MSSSTSNSEPPTPPWTWAGRVLRASAATVAVASLLLGSAVVAARRGSGPKAPVVAIEDVIVEAQLGRAAKAAGSDVLVIGDSSALMDVDAAELGRALGGKRVECLALIGFVGPAAQVEMALRAGGRAPVLVWLVNGASLALDERWLSGEPYEAWVMNGAPPPRGLGHALRDLIYAATVARTVARPLPGRFGEIYGLPEDLSREIASGHGTVTDPNRLTGLKAEPDGYRFTLSAPVEARLPRAAELLRRVSADKIRVGLTPLPRTLAGAHTESSRREVQARLLDKLGLGAEAALATDVTFPDDHFATPTHLAARGRARFTAQLARLLSEAP
jgi:hypothetical protein